MKEEGKREKVVTIRSGSKSHGKACIESLRGSAGWAHQQWEETVGDYSPDSKIPGDFFFFYF